VVVGEEDKGRRVVGVWRKRADERERRRGGREGGREGLPAKEKGEHRSPQMGSVRKLKPPICTRMEEWLICGGREGGREGERGEVSV
jgi:hypothetical protein